MTLQTKIWVTIGPSSEDQNVIHDMVKWGASVFRFNFKHNTVNWHEETIKRLKGVVKEGGRVVLDIQGRSVRFVLAKERLTIKKGEKYRFGPVAKKNVISVTHPQIIKHIPHNTVVYAGDGELSFVYDATKGVLVAQTDGILRDRVAFSAVNAKYPQLPLLTDRDKEAAGLIKKGLVDALALSFVNTAEDIELTKKFFEDQTGKTLPIVAKIETIEGVENIEEILEVADGVMVARGDLALQTPYYRLIEYQKHIIQKAKEAGKPVIVATQMLDSMVRNPFPTRAEISDVAHSVLDAPDGLMLSGETALGKYPVKSVEIMHNIISHMENSTFYKSGRSTEETKAHTAVIIWSDDMSTLGKFSTQRLRIPLIFSSLSPELVKSAMFYYGVKYSFELVVANIQQFKEYFVQFILPNLRFINPGNRVLFVYKYKDEYSVFSTKL